ncbi:DUF1810 domain-containing protein [Rhodococcus sp. 06-1460-1B]|jgi:uncharacterized protein (DUF1810 family)|uniref:DUF1810 domain-containing protein n=1 Tax=Rhodococcus sp. 06-1460-1B TaxID=2022501 RepID=UPI000B9C1676|nr:DUF1810 domain-containing protein [Rhodococcus sp. 06-1460-1B]MBY3794398.1 DUF1810 domain-containing protein [Rhodococcus fascians]MBY3827156.1 DUF1810 domain-containing protein [Rhodococcus fascians]MBY3837616.1 DUF1810 domain-containing protein [Rhodococcus fascians]MBY3866888.1 DUF1810 domain-containing protein [Rhodococcus fascians]MBY3885842.1 DUF1810 domain-containing protein [Rhodococcus fascians]
MTEYDLQRFVDAQDPVWNVVVKELKAGRKQTHWMWFVFPQLAGLGRSATAQHFGIADLTEAELYLSHEVLGPRLKKAAQLTLAVEGSTVDEIFGYPDNLKLHSSMTLFAEATKGQSVFVEVLQKYFSGEFDAVTLDLLDERYR